MFKITMLSLLVLMLSACQKDDEVVPVPPPDHISASVTEGEDAEAVTTPLLEAGPELFQYGKFMDMPFRLLKPKDFDPAKSYPLHIFLHGIGERGTDNEQQLEVGASFFAQDTIREKYPVFVVFPQCAKTQYWFSDETMETLKGLVDALASEYSVDEGKMSIGGFSMGAFGTFAMVARYPIFEAAVAISGSGEEKKAALMSKTKWRIFAGDLDDVVSRGESEKMARALQKAGASVSFTAYPEADHSSTWIKAFSEPDYFSWLFSDRKNGTPAHSNDGAGG